MKFETINNQLCRMVEPEPLTDDVKFPCVVRLIQDDSPMGLCNRWKYSEKQDFLKKDWTISSLENNLNKVKDIHYSQFEIIGYPVVDGSHWWALYQMMQGDKVTKRHLKHTYWHYDARPHLKCISEYNCGILQIMVSPDIWIKTADREGWQLYKEPKPEPAFKVGDLVEIEVSGVLSQQQATSGAFADSIKCGGVEFYANGNPVMQPLNARIIRKLKPSEVVIHIGCLSGTVERLDGNPQHWFWLRSSEYNYALISIDMLDTPTRELVQSLLKAQEEK